MTEECGCGFEAANGAGLAAHKRHCDYDEEEGGSSELFETPTSVSTAVAEDVFQRDAEMCVRCESTESLTIHVYDDDGDSIPQNLVTLCDGCDDVLGDGDPRTKRGQVDR